MWLQLNESGNVLTGEELPGYFGILLVLFLLATWAI